MHLRQEFCSLSAQIIALSIQHRNHLDLGILERFEMALMVCCSINEYSTTPLYFSIEERMHLIWETMVESGKISVTDYVRITSTECAKIFNIYPRKGAILEGSDADIIVFNPNATMRISAISHHSRSDTNVYEGKTGKGKVEVTISGGRVVWEDGNLKISPGSGKYIKMPPFSYLFDGIDKADAKYLASLNAPVRRTTAAS